MEWLDLLAVQGTLKRLLQHHCSKASILLHSAFFIAQLSHPYMTTGKSIALSRRTFVGQEMSLLFNMLSRLVITFLPRSKHLLISWVQSPSAVILEPRKIKSDTVFTFSIYFPWSDGTGCHDPLLWYICSHGVMGPDAVTHYCGAFVKTMKSGLPQWLSGKESPWQCRRHGFDPWSRKIPQAAGQLSLYTTAIEPGSHNY